MCLLRLKGEFHCSGLLDGLAPSKWAVRGPQCKINMTSLPYKNTNTPFLILLIKNSAAMGFEWFFFFLKTKKANNNYYFCIVLSEEDEELLTKL